MMQKLLHKVEEVASIHRTTCQRKENRSDELQNQTGVVMTFSELWWNLFSYTVQQHRHYSKVMLRNLMVHVQEC